MAMEVEVQEDGSMVAVAEKDWQLALFDAASIRLLGQMCDEESKFDIYEILHRDGATRTYPLEVGAKEASPQGPTGPVISERGGKA